MARYRPIYTQIWEDEDEFLNYTDFEKVLFLYLITNRSCTESGIYKVSPRNIAFSINSKAEKVCQTLEKLKPNVVYDTNNKIVFVKNFYKYNGKSHGRPDLIEKSILKDASNFDTFLWSCFIGTYPKFKQSLEILFEKLGKTIIEYDNENDNENDSIIVVKKEKKQCNIIPPKLEWVKKYCDDRKNGICPQRFIDSNKAKGWVVGNTKSKMVDWQAVIRTWEKNEYNKPKEKGIEQYKILN